jgi:hypothetical protein
MVITDEELEPQRQKLLIKQAAPASRILFMSLNILIDIFVGQWIVAVVTVVFPITFLISSLGWP